MLVKDSRTTQLHRKGMEIFPAEITMERSLTKGLPHSFGAQALPSSSREVDNFPLNALPCLAPQQCVYQHEHRLECN